MKNNYIEGMREIRTDEELKRNIFKHIKSNTNPRTFPLILRPLILVSAACIFFIIVVFGTPNNANHSELASIFDGFVITAYAENGAPIHVNPNIVFPLGKYQMTMSSVPGFPIKIESKEADTITLKVTNGSLLSWLPADSQVINKGLSTDIKPGDTLYWSPLPAENQDTAMQLTRLEITAYKNNNKIGSRTIEIKSDENYNYTGKLLE